MSIELSSLKEIGNLVSISRENLDALSIQCFLIDFTEELLLVQYVYDFKLDGLKILKRSDVSAISSNETDVFHTQLLKDDGVYANVEFDVVCGLNNWFSVLSTLGSSYQIASIENENPKNQMFLLGEIQKLSNEKVTMRCFNGIAGWDNHVSEIAYEDITLIQLGSDYANAYERHFKRHSAS